MHKHCHYKPAVCNCVHPLIFKNLIYLQLKRVVSPKSKARFLWIQLNLKENVVLSNGDTQIIQENTQEMGKIFVEIRRLYIKHAFILILLNEFMAFFHFISRKDAKTQGFMSFGSVPTSALGTSETIFAILHLLIWTFHKRKWTFAGF